ncbi:unnamed protein product, partial [Symbiodinium necroappetens]
ALGLSTIRRAGRVVDDLSLEDIIANWLAGEERQCHDWRNYFEKYGIGKDAYRVMQFEEILADPRKALTELFEWLGVPAEDSALRFIQGKVSKDANEKHFGLYCARRPGLGFTESRGAGDAKLGLLRGSVEYCGAR